MSEIGVCSPKEGPTPPSGHLSRTLQMASSDNLPTAIGNKRMRVTDAVAQRVALIRSPDVQLPPETQKALELANNAAAAYAEVLEHIWKSDKTIDFDKGRLIHAIDLLSQSKDAVKVSLSMPNVWVDVPK